MRAARADGRTGGRAEADGETDWDESCASSDAMEANVVQATANDAV